MPQARSGLSGVALGNYLVTANHFQPHEGNPEDAAAGYRWFLQPTPTIPSQSKIGDTGITVVSTGQTLHIYDFTLHDSPFNGKGIDSFGLKPAISDGTDPWIAFAANSSSMGNGIFVANVADRSKWYKVAGVSGDGDKFLDPNEAWVDQNNNGKLDQGEAQGAFSPLT